VKKLRSAHAFAGVIGLPLNAFVTVAPFRAGEADNDNSPTLLAPADVFAAFRNWLGVGQVARERRNGNANEDAKMAVGVGIHGRELRRA